MTGLIPSKLPNFFNFYPPKSLIIKKEKKKGSVCVLHS